MSLPAALERLEREYNQLVDAAEAGHISQADAISTLAGLSATDADGGVWALTADGDFVRATFPGAPAVPADPATFATVPTAPAPLPGPAMPAVPGMPAQAPAPVAVAAPPWPATDPLAAPPAGMTSPTPSAATPLQVPAHPAAPTPAAPTTPKKARKSINDAERPRLVGGLIGRIGAFLSANRVLVGIVAAGILLLAVLALQSSHAPTTTIPDQTSAGPTTATDASTPADLPTQQAPTAPTKAQALDVISALSSGRTDLVAATTQGTPADKDTTRAAALWAGTKQIGLAVTPGAAAATDTGAVQDWTVTRGRTTIATLTVTWVSTGTGWKLAALPTY